MTSFNYALIMAAGRGSRMMPLTSVIPKAMAPYADTTLIHSGIVYFKKHIENFYITYGYHGGLLAEHVIREGVSGLFDTTGKGNSWWIFNTLMSLIDEPVLVLTCDNVVRLDVESLYKDYISLRAPACMVVPVKPVIGLDGDFIISEGNIVQSLSRTVPSNHYCSGIQVINPKKICDLVPESEDFYDVWNSLISFNQLYVSNILPSHWFVADTLEQLSAIPILEQ